MWPWSDFNSALNLGISVYQSIWYILISQVMSAQPAFVQSISPVAHLEPILPARGPTTGPETGARRALNTGTRGERRAGTTRSAGATGSGTGFPLVPLSCERK